MPRQSTHTEPADLQHWSERWSKAVRSPDDFVRFVDEVGCCTWQSMPAYTFFPSLAAVVGKLKPGVPDTWFWKDDLHVEKRLYYTRVFGNQPGFVSWSMLPAFVATNGAVADELMFNGVMTVEAQQVYGAIEEYGPVPVRDLKKMLTPDARHASNRVLHDLERKFIITKVGITGRTRGTYGYIWDLVERWIPEVLTEADRLGRSAATNLIRAHLTSLGVPPDSKFYRRVLGWEG